MTTTLDRLIAADDFLTRMKKGEAAVKARLESYGYSFKRNRAKTYYEKVDWHKKFLTAAMERRQRLENEKLTIEELLLEHEDQLAEAFAFFLALTQEQQQKYAPQFKEGLQRVQEARERNREKAQRLLERQEVRCD